MRALILGIGGQDGSYMAENLLDRGAEVHGLHRRTSLGDLSRIQHLLPRIALHRGDVCDPGSVYAALGKALPDVVYNFADQDNVDWSYETPGYSVQVTAGAVSTLLEAIKGTQVKLLQPISATVFGDSPAPQDEDSPPNPLSPYACAKAHAWHLCKYHRRCYGTQVSCAILYNHDSPRRGPEYLLHRMCKAAATGVVFECDDPSQIVDIGYAKDYVESMRRMMDVEPDDYVISGSQLDLDDWARYCRCEVRRVGTKFRPGPKQNLVGNCAKATRYGVRFGGTSARQLCNLILEKYWELPLS
jgi:GDPmannose 4,6-dehydratase